LNGAAGSNAAGSLGALAQSAAINVLQSLAVSEVKNIADGFANRDPFGNVTETAQSEAVRSALQAVVGCTGAAAGGSGDCTSGAIGAAASVVFNNVLNAIDEPRAIGPDGREVPQSTKEAQARTNLVATFVAALANGVGVDSAAATNAATIETENNRNVVSDGKTLIATVSTPGTTQEQFLASVAEFRRAEPDKYSQALALFGGNEDDLINYLAQPNGQNIKDAGAASVARSDAAQRSKAEADYQADVAFLATLNIEVGSNNGGTPMTREQVVALADQRRQDQARVATTLARLEQVEQDYDAVHGYGAYRKMLAAEAAQAQATNDQATAAARRAQLELLCAGLACPALAAAGGVFAVNSGLVALATNAGRPLLTYSTTTATGGGLFNSTLGAGFDYATDEKITVGSVTGDFVAGAVFNQSYLSWGSRLNNPYVRGTISGAISGIAGETTSQAIDGNGSNGGEILQQGAFNGIGGNFGAAFNRSLNNSYAPVWQGLLTREANYGIDIQMKTTVRAGVNETVRIILPTTAIEGTVSQAAESSLDAFRKWQIPSSPNPPRVQPPSGPLRTPKPQCDRKKEKC
jgi:hypothetical protein